MRAAYVKRENEDFDDVPLAGLKCPHVVDAVVVPVRAVAVVGEQVERVGCRG